MKFIKNTILFTSSILLFYGFAPAHSIKVDKSPGSNFVNDTIIEITEETDSTGLSTVVTDTITTKEKYTEEVDTTVIPTEKPPTLPIKQKFVIPRTDCPLTKNISSPFSSTKGLDNRHIALWQSHGLYYKQSKEKWNWQRANLFETREDLYTQSYILPLLVPMLENAGATVLLPRERDIQRIELIVDNDKSSPDCSFRTTTGNFTWHKGVGSGFAHFEENYRDGENPFKTGTFIQAIAVFFDSNIFDLLLYLILTLHFSILNMHKSCPSHI